MRYFVQNVFLIPGIRELSQQLGISSVRISYTQTDGTTPSFVGSCCVRVGSGMQTDAKIPNNVGSYSASWEG